jgi:hypothetical protein
MTHIHATIKTSTGASTNGIKINAGDEITLRLYVSATTTETLINATRADFLENERTGEDSTVARANGQELIDEGMIEAKVGAGAWANICGFANALDLGAVSSASYATFSLRVVVPPGADTIGSVGVGLAIRCK